MVAVESAEAAKSDARLAHWRDASVCDEEFVETLAHV